MDKYDKETQTFTRNGITVHFNADAKKVGESMVDFLTFKGVKYYSWFGAEQDSEYFAKHYDENASCESWKKYKACRFVSNGNDLIAFGADINDSANNIAVACYGANQVFICKYDETLTRSKIEWLHSVLDDAERAAVNVKWREENPKY